jgi:hypothetical protein
MAIENTQKALKYTKIFHPKVLKKLVFWVYKYTIWQPRTTVRLGLEQRPETKPEVFTL